jgi:translation initiation factor 1
VLAYAQITQGGKSAAMARSSSPANKGLAGLSSLVYSTDSGRICPGCAQPIAACRCQALQAAARPVGDGVVRVGRVSKGRGGKTVSLVQGVPLDEAGLQALAKSLKASCGSGGTVKDGVIEIQGDHVVQLLQQLAGRGWTLRRTGG